MTQAMAAPQSDRPGGPELLVADPDHGLTELAAQGITVVRAVDGPGALLRIGACPPDVLLVSARLPGIDPVTLIESVRRSLATLPIILGTGPEDAELAMRALAAGATACVARPYRCKELLTLIHATHIPGSLPLLRVGDIELDQDAHVVRVAGAAVHVPLREYELLRYLMRNAGRVVTKHEITRKVWRSEGKPPNNTIVVHVKRLRRRLGDDERHPAILLTVRGIGYRITAGDPPRSNGT
ncbi:DNA-binding response regulator, OmpR family, contains REC and winged-helix (wHTH) domain [Nonomuraea solani]|uniref:DNA-binding response regulator, OmpR family, contains REC and winged-helix (WHTH) domain n=1 Tax=Nonomuraea solani TaxID=1144553 RepID=A0A1H6E401_9ACTN|nr:response regulator transcription factor [Nonomuraea solani]SEG91736.1 DNA-binding response regulator, OmpR family, contains REC and winged-helix (wHTH) domain [Nonomuraea solani]